MFQISNQPFNHQPNSQSNSNHQTLQKLINFKDSHNNRLLAKFTLQYIISLIDRSKIEQIQKICKNLHQGFNIIDFTRSFLNLIQHKEDQTLYITIAIIDLFKQIAFFNDVTDRVQFHHITNYICKGILSEREHQYQIKARLLPHEKKLQPTQTIRDVEVFAPIVYGKTGLNTIKLSKAKIKADRTKHTGIISAAYYSHSKKNIFCLDSMSQSIGRYNINAQLIGKITPSHSKIKRDALIMSFAYSERQQRIGALLKNLQLIFWDIEDNFEIQKSFSTAKYSSQQQVSIWFLEYHNQWLTADSIGGLCTWDLETEQCGVQIKLKNRVTELCEIRCLNLIAIAQEKSVDGGRKQDAQNKICLYNLVKNSIIMQIGVGMSSIKHRAINSLQFSNTYQILLYGDASKQITLLQINPHFFDATIKGKLIGHQYLINNFILVKKTPTVVSCDDKQKIKIWDIRNFSCVQTLDFEGKTIINRLVSMVRIDKFAIAGGRLYVIDIEKREEGKFQKILERDQVSPNNIYFEPSNNQLLVFTKKDLRFYDIQTGKINKIYTGYIDSEEQITALKYLSSCRMFILGNHQGNIRIYNKSEGNIYKYLQSHSRQITSINYDSTNHLYVTSSFDSNIYIQKQQQLRGGKFQIIRSIKDNFWKKQINFCELSVHHNMIAIGSLQQKVVFIWDYQYCKLLGEIVLKDRAQVTVIAWIDGYSMLVIGDNLCNISILEISHTTNHSFRMQLVTEMHLDDIPTHITVDLQSTKKESNTLINMRGKKSMRNRLLIAVKRGGMYEVDINDMLGKYKLLDHMSKRVNYNPERQLNQSFISEYGKKNFKTITVDNEKIKYQIQNQCIISFKAHQDDITSLIILNLKNKNYCTCSLDKRIKIWEQGGNLICDVNINLSLPYKWQIDTNNDDVLKGRVMFGLKILELIVTKNKDNISLNQWNALKINTFFKGLTNNTKSQSGFVTEPKSRTDSIKMFNDEFNKDDLDYQRSKKYCLKQIRGPRLKQLQAKKRTRSIQKNLKFTQQRAIEEKQKIMQEMRQKKNKLEQKEQLMQMFKNPNQNRNNMFKNQNKELFMKLQKLFQKPSVEQNNKQNIPKTQKIFNHHKQIRINRHRSNKTTKKHISFQQYYQKSYRNTIAPQINDSNSMLLNKYPQFAQTQTRWNKSVFGRVLNDLNEKVKWKRLLHTRSHDRQFRGIQTAQSVGIE